MAATPTPKTTPKTSPSKKPIRVTKPKQKGKSPQRSSICNEIVYILVGPSKTRFGIPKNLLLTHSPYFKQAFTTPPSSPSPKPTTLSFPSTSPSTFSFLTTWLYSQQLPPEPISNPDLIQLYILAQTLQMRALGNDILDALIANVTTAHISVIGLVGLIPLIYANTPPGSMLRRLVVDMYAQFPTLTSFENMPGALLDCPRFLQDLVAALSASACERRPARLADAKFAARGAEYHERGDEAEACPRKKCGDAGAAE